MSSTLRRLTFIAALSVMATAMFVASPAQAGGTDHAVQIADFAFSPATLTITAGDTVTWTNGDPIVHTATSTTGAFDSGDLAQGQSYSRTFSEPGTYAYLCTPHPTMTGQIIVVAGATPAPSLAPPVSPPPPPSGGGLPDVAMERPGSTVPVIAGTLLLLSGMALSSVECRRRRVR